MRIDRYSLRWILVFAILVPVAFVRIRGSLRSDEDRIRILVERTLGALEERQPRRLRAALSDRFEDEGTGYDRRDVVRAARSVLIPGTRYRATLHDPDGLHIVDLDADADPRTATIEVRCLIETRPSGANAPNSTEADFRPWWDLEFTADLERRGGRWRFVRTRDVNHDSRPHR